MSIWSPSGGAPQSGSTEAAARPQVRVVGAEEGIRYSRVWLLRRLRTKSSSAGSAAGGQPVCPGRTVWCVKSVLRANGSTSIWLVCV
ncbi:unnamed protein product [Ectocarpus sp. CCAP 1310/34]|nr:unnamed protein product [Ectocarpus sp. CCAP 1310/34]